ncbi:MAG TPA: ketoacyl-ACP synthase III, partial [Bryobacteraceae bacterium]|nr:ketoacyl-ACP synthase III [Bryobacteraceae bacterium]
MAFLKAFGSYLPERVVTNAEIGAKVGCDAEWIRNVSGIDERRFAREDESVIDLALRAAQDCLDSAKLKASDLGMILVASGSWDRQFPGPAVSVASRLGLDATPSLDMPMASAGSLFGLSLASRLCSSLGPILVIGAEKMSKVVEREPMERGVAILFGDGAGACLVHPSDGFARIVDCGIYSDGAYAEDLQLPFASPLEMNGRSVILQASRKIPRAIASLLEQHRRRAADVAVFLMHQANQNLIARVAQALEVAEDKFYSNIKN